MHINDPIGDMLTRIRNGQRVGKTSITTPASKIRISILEVLQKEGYIRNFRSETIRKGIETITVELKYDRGRPVVESIGRVSTPGKRVYKAVNDFKNSRNGLGVTVISTNYGVMTDGEARQRRVGGEVLFEIY